MTSRKWCGTLNNYTEEEWQELWPHPLSNKIDHFQYGVVGREVGEEGTPHLQIFLYFSSKKSLRQMKKVNERAHWEPANGSIFDNECYCSKEGNFEMWGDRPMDDEDKGQAGSDFYTEAWELAKQGKIEEVHPQIRVMCYNTLKRIASDYAPRPEPTGELLHEWRWGPTGKGKSRPIQEGLYGVPYIKTANTKWWDGYQGEEAVLIDDFDKEFWKLGYDLKIWADHYPFRAEVKGGSMMIRPKRIIVTSNWSIDEIWNDEQLRGPLHRRFKEIKFE